MNTENERFVREPEVRQMVGAVSRMTIWRWENDPDIGFPLRRRIGPNTTIWLESEVRDWMRNRVAATGAAAA